MPLCNKCKAFADVVGVDTGNPEDFEYGDGVELCSRCKN